MKNGNLRLDRPVWPVPTVGPHVSGDAARLGEGSIADAAVERLFTGVGAAMSSQVGRLTK